MLDRKETELTGEQVAGGILILGCLAIGTFTIWYVLFFVLGLSPENGFFWATLLTIGQFTAATKLPDPWEWWPHDVKFFGICFAVTVPYYAWLVGNEHLAIAILAAASAAMLTFFNINRAQIWNAIIEYRDTGEITTRQEAEEAERAAAAQAEAADRAKAQYEFNQAFHDVGDDDWEEDDFAYSKEEFNAGGSREAESKPDMPYGVDKRHPDDVHLHAVLDDPSASPNERMMALKTIMKNEAERKASKSTSSGWVVPQAG